MKVHIVHGIHVSEPKESIGAIAPFFRRAGFTVEVHDYGHIFALQTYWKNPGIARKIGQKVQPGDVMVGHSNGCDIIRRIAQKVPLRGAILFNPALDRDTRFDPHLKWIDVYHTRGDVAVALSRLLLWHPWGAMGRDGYVGNDPRVTNIDMFPDVNSHSGVMRELDIWGTFAAQRLEEHLTQEIPSPAQGWAWVMEEALFEDSEETPTHDS